MALDHYRRRLIFSRRWRWMKVVWALFAVELAFTIPALALFAIAQPDLYRTRLWEDGFKNKFNSNPNAKVFATVNREPYTTPVVWSQFITDYNVVISVLSMFILLVKATMFILHVFHPLLGLFVHGLLVALWAYSTYAQSYPDNTDPRFPKLSAPWYIAKNCDVAFDKKNIEYCKQGKAALSITVVMLFLFIGNLIVAIVSCIPSKSERAAYKAKQEEKEAEREEERQYEMRFDPPPQSSKAKSWIKEELSQEGLYRPKSPATMSGAKSPVTPRTFALNRLGGSSGGGGLGSRNDDLPLRERYA